MPQSENPVSPEQLAANRANAAKSTGPRTPQGKARSSQNARKHGFTAANFTVIAYEDIQEVAALRADALATYQPVNSQEVFAVERIALAQHSMLRAARLEAGLLMACLNQCLDSRDNPLVLMDPELAGAGGAELTRAQNRNFLLGEGFHRVAGKSNSWPLFLRYQAQTERLYRRAVEDLERLQALRAELPEELPDEELPNEAVLEAQPEPTEPVCAPGETNPSTPEPAAAPDAPTPPSAEWDAGNPYPTAVPASWDPADTAYEVIAAVRRAEPPSPGAQAPMAES
jgi:hypothetical protein